VSLRRTRVPESPQSLISENPGDPDFKLTLLDVPPLPVSLRRQISCWWQERTAERHLQAETPLPVLDMRPWFRNLPEQVRASLTAAKTVPANYSSRPVDVPDIWQDYLPDPFSWANSLLVHMFVLTALVLPFAIQHLIHPVPIPRKFMDYTPLVLRLPHLRENTGENHGGGGSGDRSPLPASHGALPPFARVQFTPALVRVPKTPPLLPMAATMVGPPELKLPAMKLDMPWGDPYSTAVPFSGGPGTGGSFGTGDGTGVGPGKGPGVGPGSEGGFGGETFRPGFGGVTDPVAIYSPEPAYSEEARKAKFAGIVMLWLVIDAQGLVQNARITKHLGMGLDEEAEKTVRTWKFKPAMRQGMPVPVQVQVEVSFRLF